MKAIDQVLVEGQGEQFALLAPEVINDYVETLGKPCQNPLGYTAGSLILAKDLEGVQRMFKVTANISSSQNVVEGTNVERKKLEDLFDGIDQELGSVKQALADEVEARAKLGAHNLFKPYPDAKSSALTYTKTSTGFTLQSSSAGTYLGADWIYDNLEKNTDYVISADVAITSGRTRWVVNGSNDNSTWTPITNTPTATTSGNQTLKFNTGSYSYWKVQCFGSFEVSETANSTFSNVLLELESDAYTGYLPYVPTNAQCLSADANAELGAHNLLDPATLEPTTSPSNSGLTFTNNGDGTITVTGTALKTDVFGIAGNSNTLTLSDGSYKIYVKNASRVRVVGRNTGGTWVQLANATGDTAIITASSSYTVYTIQVGYDTGVQYNTTLYPMILDPADPSTKFSPYAMTNRELSEVKSVTIVPSAYRYSNATFSAYKVGRVVSFFGNTIDSDLPNDGQFHTVATLPREYCPIATVRMEGYLDGNNISDLFIVKITAAGEVQIFRNTKNTSNAINVIFDKCFTYISSN